MSNSDTGEPKKPDTPKCAVCGKSVAELDTGWHHVLTDDYMGPCYWGRPTQPPVAETPGVIDNSSGAPLSAVSAVPTPKDTKPCPFCEGRGGNRDYRRGKPDGVRCEHCGGTGRAKPRYYDTLTQSEGELLDDILLKRRGGISTSDIRATLSSTDVVFIKRELSEYIAQRERTARIEEVTDAHEAWQQGRVFYLVDRLHELTKGDK